MAKSDEILRKTTEILSSNAAQKEAERTQLERERRELVSSLSQDMVQMLTPALEQMSRANQISEERIINIIKQIKVEAPQMPEIKLPPINVPRPSVTVKGAEQKAPVVNVPKSDPINFPESMRVFMDGVDSEKPLPVMMMDTKGKPMNFSMGSGGGGRSNFLTIKDIQTSTGASLIDAEGKLKIAGSFSATAGTEYSDGEVDAVPDGVAQFFLNGVGEVMNVVSSTNPLPVDATVTPGATFYASDAIGSTNLIQVGGNDVVVGGGYQDNALRVVHATDAVVSTVVNSGTITAVTDITNSVATYQLDADGGYRETFPIEGDIGTVSTVTAVTDITNSVAANIVDSSGVAYTTSNPLPIDDAGGSITVDSADLASIVTAVEIMDDWDATHDSAASADGPQSMVEARTSNPTAVGNGDAVRAMADDVGRQVMRPVQVRDLTATAYISLANGTETTLLAAAAGVYHDLVYVMGANQSDAAVTVDFRDVTAGGVVLSLQIPANATSGIAPSVPLPASHTGNNWTADMGDITGTTVDITALFSKEV
jgi:hypothetical protein